MNGAETEKDMTETSVSSAAHYNYELGMKYLRESYDKTPDSPEKEKCCTQAKYWLGRASELGNTEAMKELGWQHEPEKNFSAAEKQYEKAAGRGHTGSMLF